MEIEPITSASPTLISQLLECSHQEGLRRAARRGRIGDKSSISSAAALGNTAHAVIAAGLQALPHDVELRSDWFSSTWEAAVSAQRERCTDEAPPENWRRYSIVKRGTLRLTLKLRAEMALAKATALIETEMTASSSPIWGRPDIVVLHRDGTAEIIDVKTGDHAGTEPTEREVRQLQLYAVIVSEARGVRIVRLRIERVDGPSWATQARDVDARAASSKAEASIALFNSHIEDTSALARPGPACGMCRQILGCDPAWSSPNADFIGVEGEVVLVHTENGSRTTRVATAQAEVDIVGLTLTGAEIELGGRIRVAHLHVQTEDQYRWQLHRSLVAGCSTAGAEVG